MVKGMDCRTGSGIYVGGGRERWFIAVFLADGESSSRLWMRARCLRGRDLI